MSIGSKVVLTPHIEAQGYAVTQDLFNGLDTRDFRVKSPFTGMLPEGVPRHIQEHPMIP